MDNKRLSVIKIILLTKDHTVYEPHLNRLIWLFIGKDKLGIKHVGWWRELNIRRWEVQYELMVISSEPSGKVADVNIGLHQKWPAVWEWEAASVPEVSKVRSDPVLPGTTPPVSVQGTTLRQQQLSCPAALHWLPEKGQNYVLGVKLDGGLDLCNFFFSKFLGLCGNICCDL